jgi:2-(1,2-epoxy-1,2-dihydrophenyl)acetyl-CoA isomerase
MSSSILFSVENSIATITLNRPEKFNSFTKEMAYALQELLATCAADNSIRCVCITGAGKAFCAGQDLAEATSSDFPGFTEVVEKHYNPIVKAMQNMAKPIVVAVNGVAAGAGANIALAGDIVVASSSASFIQAFSKIGLVPDSGGTYFLPKLIGTNKAKALMMLGDKISAADAESMGMIYKSIPAENFEEEVKKICATVAALPTKALALTKELIHASEGNNLEQQLALECKLQTEAGNSKDYQEGVASFLEKRMPNFIGE